MGETARPVGITIVAILMVVTALLTMAFWVAFFADYAGQNQSFLAHECDGWFLWERSFPAADAWMAVACVLGAVGLWRMRPWGLLFSLVAGGALIFLGLMDILFFLQNGLYWPVNFDVATEMVIHAWVLAFGAFVIAYMWGKRGLLCTKTPEG